MEKSNKVKENIIRVATQLIEQSNGNVKNITARAIARKADIGLGLINYHFGSKDNLITICVQRIIGKAIIEFSTEREYVNDKDRLTNWAIYVFDFLLENPSISHISILGDLQNYSQECNSVYSQKGFMLALTNDVDDKDKPLLSFILTATMQTAFLSRNVAKELLGYDFTKQTNRAAFIEKLVSTILEDNRKEVSQ